MNLNQWQLAVGELMASKGFHELPESGAVPVQLWAEQRLCRVYGEVSEAGELLKKRFDTTSVNIYDAAGSLEVRAKLAEELADVIYRVLDLGYLLDLDLESAMSTKHAKNAARPVNYGTADEGKV